MAEVLKVCRLGDDWAVKDKTGAFYGRSSSMQKAKECAEAMAKRSGAQVVVRNEPGSKR